MKAPLRIAIVHYHLRPGGVTSVMLRAASALEKSGVQGVVLTGEPTASKFPFPVVVVPGLAYGGGTDGARVADELQATATSALGGTPDIWHIHNHALGKNAAFTTAVSALASRGAHLLLQIHDFAEDGRPANYRLLLDAVGEGGMDQLYPVGPHVHYALLNQRDHDRLVLSGCAPDWAHLLPNPITLPSSDTPPPPGIVLYPTRAIRRKNLGEFLLASLLDDLGRRWQTTLEPSSPADRPVYEQWRCVANELQLPVDFAVGVSQPRSMSELLAGAEAVFTTSVAEGFGLSFLEPWLVGRPVLGRDLPDITADFKSAGLDLALLYPRLDVPVEWVGLEALRAALEAGLRRLRDAYGRATSLSDVEKALAVLVQEGGVDFGRLHEPLQEKVLRRLAADPAARNLLAPACAVRAVPPGLLAHNRDVVLEHYGEANYGNRLLSIYQALKNGSAGQTCEALNAEVLLDQFLDPTQFNLLRT